MTPRITLRQIADLSPCGANPDSTTGFRKFLLAIGQDIGDWKRDTRVSLGDIVISNGVDDTMFCFRCIAELSDRHERWWLNKLTFPAYVRSLYIDHPNSFLPVRVVKTKFDDVSDLWSDDSSSAKRALASAARDCLRYAAAAALRSGGIDAHEAEVQQQALDIISAFPPVILRPDTPRRACPTPARRTSAPRAT